MEIAEFSTFWLSPAPDIPGSRFYNQSIFHRICSFAVIKDKEKDFYMRVFNTHLDHIGENARDLGMRCLLEHINKPEKSFYLPIVLLGDFNERHASKALEAVRANKNQSLTDITSDFPVTYHDYYYGRKEDSKIDYIFVSREFKSMGAELWQDEFEGVYLSDHYLVSAQLAY